MSDSDNRPPPWYVQFATTYCDSFGVSQKVSEAMVRWWSSFLQNGFVQADFSAALTDLLTGTAAPQWDREHLPLIKRALNEARAKRTRRKLGVTFAPRGETCRWCDGKGLVNVPYPGSVVDGEWLFPYEDGDVHCTRCDPGRENYGKASAMFEEGKISKGPPMTLDKYELLYGNAWIGIVARHVEGKRLMRMVEDENDTFVGGPNLIRAVEAGFGKPPPGKPMSKRRAA